MAQFYSNSLLSSNYCRVHDSSSYDSFTHEPAFITAVHAYKYRLRQSIRRKRFKRRVRIMRWRLYSMVSKWRSRWRYLTYYNKSSRVYELHFLRHNLSLFLQRFRLDPGHLRIVLHNANNRAIRKAVVKRRLLVFRRLRKYGQTYHLHYFIDLITALYLTGRYKNPAILADYIAKELCKTRRHKQPLKKFSAIACLIRLYNSVVSSIRVSIFGKINGQSRTQAVFFKLRQTNPAVKQFDSSVKQAIVHASARTGAFGVKISLQPSNNFWRLLKPIIPVKQNYSVFSKRTFRIRKLLKRYYKRVSNIKAQMQHNVVSQNFSTVYAARWSMPLTEFDRKHLDFYEPAEFPELQADLRNAYKNKLTSWDN